MASWNSHTVQHLTTAAKWSSSSTPRLCMLSSTRAGSVKSEGCNGAPAPWVNPTQPRWVSHGAGPAPSPANCCPLKAVAGRGKSMVGREMLKSRRTKQATQRRAKQAQGASFPLNVWEICYSNSSIQHKVFSKMLSENGNVGCVSLLPEHSRSVQPTRTERMLALPRAPP